MNKTTKELVAIAASVAGKCRPCFAYHYKQAKELGMSEELIQEAVQLARDIRHSGDKQIDEYVESKVNKKTTQEKDHDE